MRYAWPSSSSSSANFMGASCFSSAGGVFFVAAGVGAAFFFSAGEGPCCFFSAGAVFSACFFSFSFSFTSGAAARETSTTKVCSHALQRIFLPIAASGTRILVLHSGQLVTIVSAMSVLSPVIVVWGNRGLLVAHERCVLLVRIDSRPCPWQA